MALLEDRNHSRSRCNDPLFELLGERLPAQLSNNCSASAPASTCPINIRESPSSMRSMIAPNLAGIRIGQTSSLGLLAASLPGNHVGRDGPGASRKANQGLFGLERRFDLPHRLVNRIEARRVGRQIIEIASISGGVSRGPSPDTKLRFCPIAKE